MRDVERKFRGRTMVNELVGTRAFVGGSGVRCGTCRASDAVTAIGQVPDDPAVSNPLELLAWRYETLGDFGGSAGKGWEGLWADLARGRGWPLKPYDLDIGHPPVKVWKVETLGFEGRVEVLGWLNANGKVANIYLEPDARTIRSMISGQTSNHWEVEWVEPPPFDGASWSFDNASERRMERNSEADPKVTEALAYRLGDGTKPGWTIRRESHQLRERSPSDPYVKPGTWTGLPPEQQWAALFS